MTLKNLSGLSLEPITPDKARAAKLLAAAERYLADARLQGLSTENRFDAAYHAGDLVPESTASECVASAEELLVYVRTWLGASKPGLL